MRRLWPRGCALAVALAATACGGSPQEAPPPAGPPVPASAAEPAKAPRPLSARLTRPTMLRDEAGGRMLARVETTTEFDGDTVLAIAQRRGEWLGVRTPQRRDGELGWIPADAAELERQPYRLRVDLSERELVVTDTGDGETALRAPVAVGAPGTPTPTGTYGVTDRLEPDTPFGPYGCCVLALSGRQPNLPQGWGGGDRLAIHATPDEASVGTAASNGCLRAERKTMRRLMEIVPAGAPVQVVE